MTNSSRKRPDTLLEIARYFHTRWRALAHEVLLANPLQSSRSTSSWGSFLSFFAFQEGMLGTQISARGGWPTVLAPPGFTGWSAFPLRSTRPETRRTIRGRRPCGPLSLSAVSQHTRTWRGTPPRRLRRRASAQRVAVASAGPGIKVALPVCRQAVPGAAGMRAWAGKDGDREGD